MELLLIRHAEPVRVPESDERADPGLHERGIAQAERLAQWLAEERLEGIFSSPMRRARQTAEPVATRHNLEIVVDEELSEFDREATSYIPVEELRATRDERWLAMAEGRLDSFDVDPIEFQRGVVTALEHIISANPSRVVAVFCHGGVINAYFAHILGISKLMWFEPLYTSINRVAAARSGERSVVALNETAHLRGTGLLLR
ncbi:MAG TPA: histidine phosphatase family protein [Acidimicrobiales bacterium]|nr:histidine phosphatase family protein [Acidimicrobiales bacterium]